MNKNVHDFLKFNHSGDVIPVVVNFLPAICSNVRYTDEVQFVRLLDFWNGVLRNTKCTVKIFMVSLIMNNLEYP